MALHQIEIRDAQSVRRNASPAFYSENTFVIDDPSWAVRWLEKIGRENVQHLAKLRIFVHAVYHFGPHVDIFGRPQSGPKWCELFDKLASEAICLRDIFIHWDAEPTCWHFGGGYDVDVVRALAKIKCLERLEIYGYFAKEWPAYLKEQVGTDVWDRQGQKEWYLEELNKFQQNLMGLSP